MSWALIAILLFREPFFFTQSNLYIISFSLYTIMFNEVPDEITSYEEYSRMIKDTLLDEGKFGEVPEYTDRILAVGIAYNKNDPQKSHECKIEVLREKL